MAFLSEFLFTLHTQHDAPTYTLTTDQCGACSDSPQSLSLREYMCVCMCVCMSIPLYTPEAINTAFQFHFMAIAVDVIDRRGPSNETYVSPVTAKED